MSHERIQAELDAKRVEGAVLKRLGGIKGLAQAVTGGGVPRPIRTFMEEAFQTHVHSRPYLVSQKRGEIGEHLQRYSDAEWSRLIRTMLPQLAPSVESAWKALAHRPYQDGLTRKPFRCPQSPQTLADVRGRWLLSTTMMLGEYDVDIRWVAERAAHLAGWAGGADLGWLLAGAIDLGGETGDEVFEILKASALGEHQTGQMGRHVTQALMSSSRADAWEFVERLLLSAQRQEGLRQAILESVDEAHPEMFRRMLRLIKDENLSRFSSVVRAADTWFGFQWDGASALKIDSVLERVQLFLEDDDARAAALQEQDAETVYLALWSAAFDDVDAAVAPATALLAAESPELRFVGTHFLVQALWTTALPPLVDVVADADLRVATRALDTFGADLTSVVDGARLFDRLEQLAGRLSKRSVTLEPIVWPWWGRKLEKPSIAAAMAAHSSAVPAERMLPYVPDLDPAQREGFVRRIAGLPPRWGPKKPVQKTAKLAGEARALVLNLLGDASAEVRGAAFEAMRPLPLLQDEVDRLVDLLARKPGDLRSHALARLGALDDAALLAVADRLLADAGEPRRLAGLELLRAAVEGDRAVGEARARIETYEASRGMLSEQERAHTLAIIAGDGPSSPTLDNALGLVDPSVLRTWPQARIRTVKLDTPAARESLKALTELVLEHQQAEVRTASGETKLLVESVPYGFGPRRTESFTEAEGAVPLADIWKRWAKSRPSTLRDTDGLELLRATLAEREGAIWKARPVQTVVGLGQWSAGERFLRGLLEWCAVWDPPADAPTFLLDGLENAVAGLTAADYREIAERFHEPTYGYFDRTKEPAFRVKLREADAWLGRVRWWRDLFPASMNSAHAERLYAILRAFEAQSRGYGMLRIRLDDFLGAWHAGAADEAEFIDLLVGRWSFQARASLLREVSARKPPRALLEHPELLEIVDRCRRRVVEVEAQRGDRTTAASGLAMELRWTGGLETLAHALPALGKAHFARSFGWSQDGASRQETLSHLVVRSTPREEDTPEAFAQWAKDARIREARLVELALYAPQWATHVNHVLGWPGLEGGVWWIQAHTKDDRSWQLQEMKEIWAAEVSERTPLSATDLTEGAVDVTWFHEVHAALGRQRWQVLDAAAKYAASSAGHTRAQLFARAMGGAVTREELVHRIDQSRHQDSVRALGLLPLPEGETGRKDLLERYRLLQEFRRQSRRFGSQRQQSEGRAVAIALANLARTAGFRDPQRLQWAMEQEAVADLAQGPVVLTRGDVTVALSIDVDGTPSLSMERAGKALKSLPAALKKDEAISELKERLQELKRQGSRVRGALEEAMCRGDRFAPAELRALLGHAILAPELGRLVFVGEGMAGYLAEGGHVLRDHAGALHAIGSDEPLRIAHPDDLFRRGDWSGWQRECFRAERVQPFKQLFRELYPLTDGERGTQQTRRYAGHQVGPRQALALLGGRGWVARPEEGVSRTFHEDGLTVRLGFQEAFYTPADVEGLTLEEVVFTRKGEWKPLALEEIPSRVFSEAMRDLDLVVSVAHQGGVNPEATASTVEMRAALIQETCDLLGIRNVELQPTHVVVRGELGTYSIHLGSAGVLLMPGTALPVVAVHSQHRGRMFLPFADDDPRTAEVLSKVLLFARDREIRDPSILERIRAAAG